VARVLGDPDEQVRRLAVSAPAADRAAIDRGLRDRAWLVRYEALRAHGRRFQASEGCGPLLDALDPRPGHVSLLAIDLLGNPCRPEDKAAERLIDLAMGTDPEAWHSAAHAIAALSKAAPGRARPYLARFLEGEPWQRRMYGARAAAQVGDVAALKRLAADADENVREAAVAGLARTAGHDADAIYLAALGGNDFQLVMTAASALAGTPDKAVAVPALLAALARLTALDADPSRDPRVAVLERLLELGSRDVADALRPYLGDTDPRVAALAARALSAWTGTAVAATPRPWTRALPSLGEDALLRLSKTEVRVTMAGGGRFDVRLLADVAPVSAALFVERASRGYFTGLTFHRILPNFLIQGGSPGANEYMGDTRYMIDEPGRATQARGTVGTSTRGRDTGDGQIYVNLVDSPRLDHEYTIFGEVVRGMDVVDRILEGDVMKKVEVIVR
jgi:cyclophilin family peptidyl-prolyl cis-trans isomerase/HEAT repeat protein